MHPAQQLEAMCRAHLDAVSAQRKLTALRNSVGSLRRVNLDRDSDIAGAYEDYAMQIARLIDAHFPVDTKMPSF